MTTPGAACMEVGQDCQTVRQKQSPLLQLEPTTQDQHMAAGSVDAPWVPYHGLTHHDDSYASALSNDQSIIWPPSSYATEMPIQDHHNYQLEAVPDHMDSGNLSSRGYGGLPIWPSIFYSPTNPLHPPPPSPVADPGRPRTFPIMDVSPMLTAFGDTIAPHDLYQSPSLPRSDPFRYGEDFETYTRPDVCNTVEDCTSLQQGHFQYYGHNEENPSHRSTPFDEEIVMDEDEGLEGEKHEPYAKSLYRCLRDAPDHTMVLRDIYEWFKVNTARGKDPHEKGWQNSIRHNLSMNQGFIKLDNITPEETAKKGFKWRLSSQALRDGRVQSTTRFRNKQPNKRGAKSRNPAPHRQASGAKGGRMARFAAEARRSERLREARSNLKQSYHDLRSSGIIPMDMPTLGHMTSMSMPISPNHVAPPVIAEGMLDSESGASSPYLGFEQTYDWPQYPQYTSTPELLAPYGAMQQETNIIVPGTHINTPMRNSETHWLPPTDGVFYDSSEASTPITVSTPNSYDDIMLHPTVFTNQQVA